MTSSFESLVAEMYPGISFRAPESITQKKKLRRDRRATLQRKLMRKLRDARRANGLNAAGGLLGGKSPHKLNFKYRKA